MVGRFQEPCRVCSEVSTLLRDLVMCVELHHRSHRKDLTLPRGEIQSMAFLANLSAHLSRRPD
jgi:hypothetical protein